jgi:hypothetical protein
MEIEHLSKWDLSVEFMLYEAAALIVGIDPVEICISTEPAHDNPRIYDYHDHPEIKPAVDRMKRDFFSAMDLYLAMRNGEWKHSSAEPLPESVLRRREMEIIPLRIGSWCLPLDPATQAALDTWQVEEDGTYETAKFTRTELSRWLSVNCLKSVYGFDLELTKTVTPVDDAKLAGARWPAHETKNLTALRLAAVKWWTNYSPNDPTTAPKNEVVIEWLIKAHDLSPTLAGAMATILRADKLKTGPRPR